MKWPKVPQLKKNYVQKCSNSELYKNLTITTWNNTKHDENWIFQTIKHTFFVHFL